MKNHLHFLWAAMFAAAVLPAAAQTKDSPQVLSVGSNSVQTEQENTTVYFSFTPTENCVVRFDGCYVTAYGDAITAIKDGTKTKVLGAYNGNPDAAWVAFNADAGVEYTFSYSNMRSASYTIDCSVSPREGGAFGKTCADPLGLSAENQVVFPVESDSSTWSEGVAYAKYVCEKTGRLEITASTYVSGMYVGYSCDDINERLSSNSTSNGYVYALSGEVEEGDVIYIKGSNGSPFLATVNVVEVVPGASCTDAIVIKDGEPMTIPAAAGEYWYQVTNSTGSQCTFVVTSDCAATVEVGPSCSAMAYSSTKYDSLNFRINPVYSGEMKVLKIVKSEATDQPETFTATFEKPQPIEDPNVGESITAGEAVTTPSQEAEVRYYYSITAPSGEAKQMVITNNGNSDIFGPYTSVITVKVPNSYNSPTAKAGETLKMQTTPGATYILTVVSKANSPVTFTVDFENLEAGSLSTCPIEMGLESADVPAFSPVYYSFTPEEAVKVLVSCDIEGANISAQVGQDYYGTVYFNPMTLNSDETGVWFSADADKQYMFTVNKPAGKEGETGKFTLEQAPFDPGESWTTAIDANIGKVALPEGTANVWYKLTATQDGFLIMSDIDIDYSYEGVLAYVGNVSGEPVRPNTAYDSNYNSYYTTMKVGVAKDQVVYFHFNYQDQAEPSVMLAYEEAAAGSIPATAIALEYAEDMEAVKVPGNLDYSTYVWYSIELPAGSVSISSPNQVTVTLYAADNTNQPLKQGNYNSGKDYGILGYGVEAGKYYFTASYTSDYNNPVNEIELSISVREPQPGETIGNAIVVSESGQEVDVPELSYGSAYWFKIEAQAGALTIKGENGLYFMGSLYDSAKATVAVAQTSSTMVDEETREMWYGISDFQVSEPNDYYFCISMCQGGGKVTFSGTALGEVNVPAFPEEFTIKASAESLEIEQVYDDELEALTIMVSGTVTEPDFTLTFDIPEGWENVVLMPVSGIFSANESLDGEEEEPAGALVGPEFKFTAPTRYAMYNGALMLDGEVYEEKGFLLCVAVDYEEVEESVAVNVDVVNGTSFAFEVSLNSTTRFSLDLPENFEVVSAELNGEEIEVAPKYTVVAEEEDFDYVFNVDYVGELKVIDSTVGVEQLTDKIKIYVKDGEVTVDNTVPNDIIKVYTVGGMLVKEYKAQSTAVVFKLEHGTYIVIVDGAAAKVIL